MKNEKLQTVFKLQLPITAGPSGVPWDNESPGPEIEKSPAKQQELGSPNRAFPEIGIV
jgi:hypothetical protein